MAEENKVRNSVPMRPGKNGGLLRAGGTPGNKGGGRPRNAWREFCREMLHDEKVRDALMKRARKGQHATLKLLVAHGEGMPTQKITIDADAGALDRLFARLAPRPADTPG
jgi:hypothetical protein